MNLKYSKSASFYKSIKGDFLSENEAHLRQALRKNKFYTTQPKRVNCKLCGDRLPTEADFTKHLVSYVFCESCDHLNGLFDDTAEYAEYLYTQDGGKNYAQFYKDDKYQQRLDNIYMPKVEYLQSIVGCTDFTLYDFGCGLGHFVECANRLGISAKGGDVSERLVSAGNELSSLQSDIEPLELIHISDGSKKLENLKVDVLSSLAVIEHLHDLDEYISSVRAADFKYFYYSVPTYGFSVTIENIFERIFPRHLSAGHTHLFTEKSRVLLEKKLGVKSISEWRFGTDIQDLRRSIEINLQRKSVSQRYLRRVREELDFMQDELQSAIDRSHLCSQVHVVCEKLK